MSSSPGGTCLASPAFAGGGAAPGPLAFPPFGLAAAGLRTTAAFSALGTATLAGAFGAAAALAPILGPHLGWSPEVVAFALPYSLAVMAQMRRSTAFANEDKGAGLARLRCWTPHSSDG